MVLSERLVTDFVLESNRIEGITGARAIEVEATQAFIAGPRPTLAGLRELALTYAPGVGFLRERQGMDVRVGNHVPPRGGPHVYERLRALLDAIEGATPYNFHVAYEALHPFMDGNGRTGRALWAWQMVRGREFRRSFGTHTAEAEARGNLPSLPLDWDALHLGFLHRFYYQTLQASDRGQFHV